MKELIEYRRRLVDRLAEAGREFRSACEARDPASVVEGDWTVRQVAAHVREVDQAVYGARVRRTLGEDNPAFASFDADAWMAGHYDPREPLVKILDEFQSSLDDLCRRLDGMPASAWSRLSRHETAGEGLTLQLWVERSLAHIEEHLQAVRGGRARQV